MEKTLTPLVSVLLPVFNARDFVRESVGSILNQTLVDFELIIINDGSADDSLSIIQSIMDNRIIIINNEKNIGLIASLNKGLDVSRGEYVARMDADDISMPDRLEKQFAFMEMNPGIGVCGSFYKGTGKLSGAIYDFSINDEEMRCQMLFNSPIAHPTAFMRRKVLVENNLRYSSEHIHAEDFALWTGIAEKSRLANFPECLLQYRIHPAQVSTGKGNAPAKMESVSALRKHHLSKLSLNPSAREFEVHTFISESTPIESSEMMREAEQWLLRIRMENGVKGIYHTEDLDKVLIERWLRTCINHAGGMGGFKLFFRSELFNNIDSRFGKLMSLRKTIFNAWRRNKLKG